MCVCIHIRIYLYDCVCVRAYRIYTCVIVAMWQITHTNTSRKKRAIRFAQVSLYVCILCIFIQFVSSTKAPSARWKKNAIFCARKKNVIFCVRKKNVIFQKQNYRFVWDAGGGTVLYQIQGENNYNIQLQLYNVFYIHFSFCIVFYVVNKYLWTTYKKKLIFVVCVHFEIKLELRVREHTHTQTHAQKYKYMHTYVYVYIYMYGDVYIYMTTYMCMGLVFYLLLHVYACLYIYTYIVFVVVNYLTTRPKVLEAIFWKIEIFSRSSIRTEQNKKCTYIYVCISAYRTPASTRSPCS